MASAGRIAAFARRHDTALVKVDDIGVGGGVLDALLAAGVNAVGCNVGEAAFDKELYANRRAEIFAGLRDRFKAGDISIPKDDTLLVDQLTSLRFSYTPRGQMKLESKEDMRKRRGTSARWASPDRADALAIAFASGGPSFPMGAWAAGPRPR